MVNWTTGSETKRTIIFGCGLFDIIVFDCRESLDVAYSTPDDLVLYSFFSNVGVEESILESCRAVSVQRLKWV